MNRLSGADIVLEDVVVPAALTARPDQFGPWREGDCLRGDLVIRNGRAAALTPVERPGPAQRLVSVRLAEPHVHLDKCHTAARMGAVGGDLAAAIAAQSEDKRLWTLEDLRARAGRGLAELAAAGCRSIRSHVDWPGGDDALTPPTSWEALVELADEQPADLRLQLSPLASLVDLRDEARGAFIAGRAAEARGALGAFVLDQPERREGIMIAFRLAERFGLPLDFHVDEGLDEGLDGLSIIADVALETGFQGPILCGHACSLMNLDGGALEGLLDRVARAGITVVSLPSTNLYLQSRWRGSPDRRGLTRIRELDAAGVPVALGADNVADAFCPVGRHDPLHTLSLAVMAAHLDPPLGDHLPKITTAAEAALGFEPTYVDGAALEDLLVFEASSTIELLASGPPPIRLADYALGERA